MYRQRLHTVGDGLHFLRAAHHNLDHMCAERI
jgi:hypothetical protein